MVSVSRWCRVLKPDTVADAGMSSSQTRHHKQLSERPCADRVHAIFGVVIFLVCMSLLYQTARYLLLTALTIALVGSVGFYTLIHHKIRHEVDEILVSQVEQTQKRLQHQPFANYADWDDNPHIEPGGQPGRPRFSDVVLPDSMGNDEPIQFRQLLTTIVVHGQSYRVRVRQPYYEFNELAREMSAGIIIGFLMLMALSVLVGLGLAQRLWRPFYETINQLEAFRLDSSTSAAFPTSRVREFGLLSRSLDTLTQKIRQQFLLQKQFTENASHELQTPLAIASAELDFVLQSDHLTEADYSHLQQTTDALARLSQLNRSLLLLTQVENDQFITSEPLDISQLLTQYLHEFEPFFTHKQLTVTQAIAPGVKLVINPQLAGVLLTNLLKNTARHCPVGGQVFISLTSQWLTIQNSGQPLPFEPTELFHRFVKDPARPDSIGLGLALVKQICDRYGLPLTYHYDTVQQLHSFQIGLDRHAQP